MSRVSMVVSGDVRYDGRVLREASALREAGYDVHLHDEGRYSPSAGDRVRWLLRAARDVLMDRPDVVHCHDLDALPIGVAVKRLSGARLIYDVHEFFYDMMLDGPLRKVSGFFRKVEPGLAADADLIVSANEGIQRYVEHGLFRSSVLVRNVQGIPSGEWTHPPSWKPFGIIYIGTIQPGRFVERAARAVMLLDGVRMTIWGTKGKLKESGFHAPQVVLCPAVENRWVIPLTIRASVVLSMNDPSRFQNREGFPNKVYEAMAAGRPVLVSEGTRAADFVRSHDTGLVCDYDAASFRDAVVNLRDDPGLIEAIGRRAHALAKARYNWNREKEILWKAYRRLA